MQIVEASDRLAERDGCNLPYRRRRPLNYDSAERTTHIEVFMDRPWVAIQRNPTSGAGSQRRPLMEFVRELRRLGYQPRVFRDRDMLRRWIDDPQKRSSLVCVVAAGGDGTVADVLNRCPGIPLAILPTGTENLFSRFLKIPRSGRAVAAMIAEGRRRVLDLGQIGSRRFAVMASAGFDADVIRRAHAARKGHISRLDYVRHIFGSLRDYDFPAIRVWLDDDPQPRTARLVIAMNVPAYALGLQVARAAREDDGLLDVRLFERGSVAEMLRYFTAVGLGWHEQLSDVQSVQVSRLRLESDRPVPIQIDGDPAGCTPAEIQVLPGALEVYTPREAVIERGAEASAGDSLNRKRE